MKEEERGRVKEGRKEEGKKRKMGMGIEWGIGENKIRKEKIKKTRKTKGKEKRRERTEKLRT